MYALVEVGPRAHRFRNETTAETRVIELAELAALVDEPVPRSTTRAAELAYHQRNAIDPALLEREAHILEVTTGRPLRGGTPRPE
ncbi:hypothetical protein ASE16_02075 [Leifsonia sp. Root227]|nr:hypothetical protein ASE16_02075 [Leifsonia sp. Root227]